MSILVTGAAGFIGFSISSKLLLQEKEVIGIDNLNNYYDVELKKSRLKQLVKHTAFTFLNVGNNNPVKLKYFIEVLEKNLGKKAIIHFQSMHSADVMNTYADMTAFEKAAGKLPHTSIEVGVARFVKWYKQYYQIECMI